MTKRSINELIDTTGPMTFAEWVEISRALRQAREALRRYESHEPYCYEEGLALLKKWNEHA